MYDKFYANEDRIKQLQDLLELANVAALGESSETKTIYHATVYNTKAELARLEEEQRKIVKETNANG